MLDKFPLYKGALIRKVGKLFEIISKLLNSSTTIYYKGLKTSDLIIYDDFFPNPVSGFRLDEFSYLLNHILSSKALIDSKNTYALFGYSNQNRVDHLKKFYNQNTKDIDKTSVAEVVKFNNINCRLVYTVFYINISRVFKFLDFYQIPFVFTLYPGGGFIINNNDVDKNLAKILSSDLCKGVIVNQRVTKNYLIDKGLCNEDKIKFIYGLPVSKDKLGFDFKIKKYYSGAKKRLDICFVGAKYSEMGMDKGYDLFIGSAKLLQEKYDFVFFHVIGGFNEFDISVSELKGKIKFYGHINSAELQNHLVDFDIILAPNRANVLSPGAFDGFPVGCCIEASLVGCCIITTDPFNENQFYDKVEEIGIVLPELESVYNKVEELIASPQRISLIGLAGMRKTQHLYSEDTQLKDRVTYLKNVLSQL